MVNSLGLQATEMLHCCTRYQVATNLAIATGYLVNAGANPHLILRVCCFDHFVFSLKPLLPKPLPISGDLSGKSIHLP